jgi:hypothetical protein
MKESTLKKEVTLEMYASGKCVSYLNYKPETSLVAIIRELYQAEDESWLEEKGLENFDTYTLDGMDFGDEVSVSEIAAYIKAEYC